MKCAVITPVGPGHEALLAESCAPSIAQAKAFGQGPFEVVDHLVMDDTRGEHGRSNRRNEALQQARRPTNGNWPAPSSRSCRGSRVGRSVGPSDL